MFHSLSILSKESFFMSDNLFFKPCYHSTHIRKTVLFLGDLNLMFHKYAPIYCSYYSCKCFKLIIKNYDKNVKQLYMIGG